jgi:hypothetical protein
MKADKCISCFLRRKPGTADNLETTSDLLSSKIQEAKVFVKAMRVFV